MKHKGFTVVELIVVIVVIGILASISLVSYKFVREDAVDTKIRAAVNTVGDAIALHEGQTNSRVAFGTNGVLPSGSVSTLVPKYLKADYKDGLTSKNLSSGGQIMLVFSCGDGSGGFVVYASLNNPSSDDVSRFNSTRKAVASGGCGQTTTEVPSSTYNYAKVF